MSSEKKPRPKAPTVVNCPTCGKPVEWSEKSPWRPFCSERCRLIDLGEWLTDPEETPRGFNSLVQRVV